MKTLLLIDGHSLLHRAFHAMPPFTSPSGKPVGALYGFARMLLTVLTERKPHCIIIAWDTPSPTFRHQMYISYKEHRPDTDPSLKEQIEGAKEVAGILGITQFSVEGYEADDVIGTVADQITKINADLHDNESDSKIVKQNTWKVQILSSDHDLLQLIKENISVLITQKGITQLKEYHEPQVIERHGVSPKQITDLKGLMGDNSDNIPGVKGIGEKTAAKLLKEYSSVENLYQNVGNIKGKVQELLIHQQESAYLSKKLATIRTDAPIKFSITLCEQLRPNIDSLRELFQELGFSSLKGYLSQLNPLIAGDSEKVSSVENQNDLPRSSQESFAISELTQANKDSFFTWLKNQDILFLFQPLDQSGNYSIFTENQSWVFNLELFSDQEFLATLRDLLRSKKVIGYDLKTMYSLFLSQFSLSFIPFFDLKLAETIVLHGHGSKDIETLIFRHGGVAEISSFNKEIADSLINLYRKLEEDLNTDTFLKNIFYEIEMPLVDIIGSIECRGVLIDREKLKSIEKDLLNRLKDVEQSIFQDIGHEINLNSPKQLEEVLFDEIKLPVIKKTKTQRSTNEQVLRQLRAVHPIIDKVLLYRSLSKLTSTYTSKLLLITEETERIHTQYNQLQVVTARISSEEPNLQNIPRDKEIGLRNVFIAPKGFVLLSCDYSQIELRILAHLSKDERLINSFNNNQDIHTVTAARLFDCFVNDVKNNQRQVAKTINYAVVYGMGAHALSETLDIEYIQAQKYINDFYEFYPQVKEWKNSIIENAKKNGYIETLWGRKIGVPELQSPNRQLQSAGERMATNYPNQGTQADLIKKAMIDIDRYVKENKHKESVHAVLQVHDELVFEIEKELSNDLAREFKKIMENAMKLDVPIITEAKVGDNWAEMELIKPQ